MCDELIADGQGWNDHRRGLAVQIFELDVYLEFVDPVVSYEDDLMHDPRFQVRDKMGKVCGVRCACHVCESNEFRFPTEEGWEHIKHGFFMGTAVRHKGWHGIRLVCRQRCENLSCRAVC